MALKPLGKIFWISMAVLLFGGMLFLAYADYGAPWWITTKYWIGGIMLGSFAFAIIFRVWEKL